MDPRLAGALERARSLGLLGPGSVADQVTHALGFRRAWEAHRGSPPTSLCDLGSGGGLPGIVLAQVWPACRTVLLEASARRCAFLRGVLGELGLDRAEVAEGPAEQLAREPGIEGSFDLVTARSFGPPAVVAECAARLLDARGLLLVADPPGGAVERWPADGLMILRLELLESGGEPAIAVIRPLGACPDRYPRRVGIPAKRPLF